MKATPLSVVRLGAPGAPKLREIARRMKSTPAAVSQFELGQRTVSRAFLARYAKAIGNGVTVRELERRSLLAQLAFYEGRRLQTRRELLKLGIRPGPGRSLVAAW